MKGRIKFSRNMLKLSLADCADIIGTNDCVIELQHSAIAADEIAEREDFYGNMVWVFDATERFEMIEVGRRVFFAFRRTKHISTCRKPVFLDFGNVLVAVEEFTTAVAKMDGFGRTRFASGSPIFISRIVYRKGQGRETLAHEVSVSGTRHAIRPDRACEPLEGSGHTRSFHDSQGLLVHSSQLVLQEAGRTSGL